jgi:hypothetical protein
MFTVHLRYTIHTLCIAELLNPNVGNFGEIYHFLQ